MKIIVGGQYWGVPSFVILHGSSDMFYPIHGDDAVMALALCKKR